MSLPPTPPTVKMIDDDRLFLMRLPEMPCKCLCIFGWNNYHGLTETEEAGKVAQGTNEIQKYLRLSWLMLPPFSCVGHCCQTFLPENKAWDFRAELSLWRWSQTPVKHWNPIHNSHCLGSEYCLWSKYCYSLSISPSILVYFFFFGLFFVVAGHKEISSGFCFCAAKQVMWTRSLIFNSCVSSRPVWKESWGVCWVYLR